MGMNRTMNNFNRGSGLSQDTPNPNTYLLPSKDKRNQIPAFDVKNFIRDENGRRALMGPGANKSSSVGHPSASLDLSTAAAYLHHGNNL